MKRHDKSESQEVKKEDRGREIVSSVLDWLISIFTGVLVGVLLVVFVVQRDNVYGDSMVPTLRSGCVVLTQKISTYFHWYKRGDVVVLDGSGMDGYNHEEYLIKRIVGMPGDSVKIEDGHVYIKEAGSDEFYMLDESYLGDGIETFVMSRGQALGYDEITLGDDEYFCLGDNRPVSNDSRSLGPFTANRIKGVAFIEIYPFSEFGLL